MSWLNSNVRHHVSGVRSFIPTIQIPDQDRLIVTCLCQQRCLNLLLHSMSSSRIPTLHLKGSLFQLLTVQVQGPLSISVVLTKDNTFGYHDLLMSFGCIDLVSTYQSSVTLFCMWFRALHFLFSYKLNYSFEKMFLFYHLFLGMHRWLHFPYCK